MENFLAALVDEQTRVGHQVVALVHSHAPDGLPSRPQKATTFPSVIRVPCYGRLLYAPVSPAFPVWLARAIADFQPDILHLHLPNTSAFWALVIPSARRLPWVIHWHADVVSSAIDPRLKLAYWLYRPFEQALLRRATSIVATSPTYLESSPALRSWRNKSYVVPLGLPPLDISIPSIGKATRWQDGALKVLAIGRLTYYKGFEILIQAIAKLPDTQAIIVGDGELRAKLEVARLESGAPSRIRFAGKLTTGDLQSLQQTCDVLVLPSLERTEAFGVVLLEAMQHAKAIVASDISGSGVGWVLAQGSAGILVPPGDAEALARGIGQMRTPETRSNYGRSGHNRFAECFRIDRVVDAMDQVYRCTLEHQVNLGS